MEMTFMSQIWDGLLKFPEFYGSKCYSHYRHWSILNRLIGECEVRVPSSTASKSAELGRNKADGSLN